MLDRDASPVPYLIRGGAICLISCQERATIGCIAVTRAELVRERESVAPRVSSPNAPLATRTRRQIAGRGSGHFGREHRLARLRLKSPPHAFGVVRDLGEIGARRLVGLGAALLPIAQGASGSTGISSSVPSGLIRTSTPSRRILAMVVVLPMSGCSPCRDDPDAPVPLRVHDGQHLTIDHTEQDRALSP